MVADAHVEEIRVSNREFGKPGRYRPPMGRFNSVRAVWWPATLRVARRSHDDGKIWSMEVPAGYDDIYSLPAEESRTPSPWEISAPRAPVSRLVPVAADGVLLGVVVEHELGVKFVAMHERVTTMDQSVWPSAAYAQSSAQQLFKAGTCPSVDRDVGKNVLTGHWWRRIWNSLRHHP
jgi:hypothetical protein